MYGWSCNLNMQFFIRHMLIADVYVNYVNIALNWNKEWKQSRTGTYYRYTIGPRLCHMHLEFN